MALNSAAMRGGDVPEYSGERVHRPIGPGDFGACSAGALRSGSLAGSGRCEGCIANYDALVVRNQTPVTAALPADSHLRVIGRFGVGLDNIDVVAAKQSQIPVIVAKEPMAQPSLNMFWPVVFDIVGD